MRTDRPNGRWPLLDAEGDHDLVVLDLLLSGISGMEVLAALLAQAPHVRVLVPSAGGDVQARVRCVDLSEVNFLAKPFAVSDQVAGCAPGCATWRPSRPCRTRSSPVRSGSTLCTRRLLSGGRSIELSQREFSVLQRLMRRAGEVCIRAELLAEVSEYAFDPASNVVDVTIARLRGKIEGMRIETGRTGRPRRGPGAGVRAVLPPAPQRRGAGHRARPGRGRRRGDRARRPVLGGGRPRRVARRSSCGCRGPVPGCWSRRR